MQDKEFFEKGFDDVTLTKLDIYERYLQEWLPVPLSGAMFVREAVVYDLFCGPGNDSLGSRGSPLRARDVLLKNRDTIVKSEVQVRLVFNDHLTAHIEALRNTVGVAVHSEKGNRLASIDYHSEEFDALFPKLSHEMNSNSANLLFIDQFGATTIDEGRFRELHSLRRTDILFFVSSDWFRRFAGRPEAAEWGIDKQEIMKVDYRHVHRFMAQHFRDLIGGEYYVAPFSLKKGSNIYGLIFASHNPLGLDKFLRVAWATDPHTGEANFDIFGDGTRNSQQLGMFESRKVSEFQSDLRQRLQAREFASDRDIYLHMLQSGFLNKHTKPIVSEMASKKAGVIEFREHGRRAQPRLSSASLKEPRGLFYLEA